ncbi:hypothetical protein M9458_044688, partial [Cirrhinus mrigala]
SGQGFFSAAAATRGRDIQVIMQNAPPASKAPRTSAPPRGPVELPKQFASPHAGLSEVEMSAAASDSAARRPSAVAARLSWTLNYRLCSSKPPRRSVWRCPGGYVAVPQVERAITWRDRPHLPSRAAYHAAGQAATALHAVATLRVYQARALKQLHEGGPDQGI